MSKRLRILAGLLLAGILGFFLCHSSGPCEPIFEGRPLTSWLDHHVASSAAIPPYGSPGWKKADEAIRHIGTNAIPSLLEMIRARDRSPLVLNLMATARRVGLLRNAYRPASWRHEEAEYAFRILGTNAASAVPQLTRIYEQNISASSQMYAALSLGNIGHGAKAAIPTLIQRFSHTNANVRFYAVLAVAHIGSEPAVVVPALTSALKDSNVDVCWNALSGLMRFGGRARAAVPEILKMTNDPRMVGGISITQQVGNVLWRIAPEKVGKPLVVEDATPMIANGLTTQALKMIFQGKRQTLIPPGHSIPATAQYWNSDPRPRLTVFRGAAGSDDKDHYLGDFEVMGVAETNDLNVSTLCVVVDGQIIICARDNNTDKFLEIRRIDPASSR